jgi:hypothetical protein
MKYHQLFHILKDDTYFLITDILKILKSIDNNPLYYYCILKTVLTKKNLLTESNKKELIEILDIKPIIKEKVVYREKIVYKEKKVKRVYEDDY